jgi:hypothetical protein
LAWIGLENKQQTAWVLPWALQTSADYSDERYSWASAPSAETNGTFGALVFESWVTWQITINLIGYSPPVSLPGRSAMIVAGVWLRSRLPYQCCRASRTKCWSISENISTFSFHTDQRLKIKKSSCEQDYISSLTVHVYFFLWKHIHFSKFPYTQTKTQLSVSVSKVKSLFFNNFWNIGPKNRPFASCHSQEGPTRAAFLRSLATSTNQTQRSSWRTNRLPENVSCDPGCICEERRVPLLSEIGSHLSQQHLIVSD